jgi:hypothetical protein
MLSHETSQPRNGSYWNGRLVGSQSGVGCGPEPAYNESAVSRESQFELGATNVIPLPLFVVSSPIKKVG